MRSKPAVALFTMLALCSTSVDTDDIQGTLTVKGQHKSFMIRMGVGGSTSSSWGTSDLAESLKYTFTGYPISHDLKGGLRFKYESKMKGLRLVHIEWSAHYTDWRWLEPRKDPRATVPEVSFIIDPSSTGTVEVTVHDPSALQVMFALADDNGEVPDWKQRPHGGHFTEEVKNGKSVIRGVRPGKYVFYLPEFEDDRSADAPKISAPVELAAKGLVKIDLGKQAEK